MTSIIFAADGQYLPYLPCNLAQVARFGRRAERVVLAVPSELDSAGLTHVEAIEEVASALGISLRVVPIPELAHLHPEGAPDTPQHVSHFTFSKLLLADTLPDLDQVLYLDVDTMIRAPLDDLLDWELCNPLGAVAELTASGVPLFGSVWVPYFNAGVLRMSLSRLRAERLWDKAVDTMAAQPGLKHQDQDVLNLLFRGRFDSLPLSFNVHHVLAERHRTLPIYRSPAIVHFLGPAKPWHSGTASPYAAEWRLLYQSLTLEQLKVGSGQDPAPGPGNSGYWRFLSVMKATGRRLLPGQLKRRLRPLGTRALNGAIVRLHLAQLTLNTDASQTVRSAAAKRGVRERNTRARYSAAPIQDDGLDLVISVARSGTNALGAVIRRHRPEVHYMSELYSGMSVGLERADLARYPWFAKNRAEIRRHMAADQRARLMEEFCHYMSDRAVEFTHGMLERRRGRTLIKLFPNHLSAEAVEAVLREFRPRLLFLRRHLLFTFLSRLRARESDSWAGTDSSDVAITISEPDILPYVHMCDSFMDHVGRLARELDLACTAVTYNGLYATGADVPLVESFYPGEPLPVHPDAGRLESPLPVQDRRTDASLHHMIASFDALSTESKHALLRLPGQELDQYLSQRLGSSAV